MPWHRNYELSFDKVHDVLRDLIDPFAKEHVLGVGVALPGFIDKSSGNVIAAENLNWFGVEAGRLMRRHLQLPFYDENAAKLSALAEMWSSDRDPKPLRNFVTVTAKGGLVTGVIVNGQILHGSTYAGGEFGHMVLYPDGRRCRCGNTGCWTVRVRSGALPDVFRDVCAGWKAMRKSGCRHDRAKSEAGGRGSRGGGTRSCASPRPRLCKFGHGP